VAIGWGACGWLYFALSSKKTGRTTLSENRAQRP
jgi:hypothetical protein